MRCCRNDAGPLGRFSRRGVMADLMAWVPVRTFVIALLRRGAILWLLVRLMFFAVSGRSSVSLLPTTALALALVVGAFGLLDARRRNEHRFLANLGVSQIVIAMLSTIPALVGELAVNAAGFR